MKYCVYLFFTFLAKDYEVAVESLILEDIIGQGQFGDVYKGVFKSPVSCFVFNYLYIYWYFLILIQFPKMCISQNINDNILIIFFSRKCIP